MINLFLFYFKIYYYFNMIGMVFLHCLQPKCLRASIAPKVPSLSIQTLRLIYGSDSRLLYIEGYLIPCFVSLYSRYKQDELTFVLVFMILFTNSTHIPSNSCKQQNLIFSWLSNIPLNIYTSIHSSTHLMLGA